MIHGVDTSFLIAVEIATHTRHKTAAVTLQSVIQAGDRLALTPLVLAEFAHVATDQRRCEKPLSMTTVLERAEQLWNAPETVQLFPTVESVEQFFDWMKQFRLGRKRILDTQLAAMFHMAGIASVLTLNSADFAVFGCFTFADVS